MEKRFETIRSLLPFLLISGLFILTGLLFLYLQEKTIIHLTINGLYNGFFDSFFYYFTFLGDGIFTAIFSLVISIALYKKYGWSTFVLGALCMVLTGLLAQFFKQVIFPEALRPLAFFGDGNLRLIPDLEVYRHNSFPSGHTAAAFAFFIFVSFVLLRKRLALQILTALCAVGVGYSRMYLSQHFLEDVVFGACLGLIAFLIAYQITRRLPFQQNIARS